MGHGRYVKLSKNGRSQAVRERFAETIGGS